MMKKPLYFFLAAASCLSFPMIAEAGLSMPLSPNNVMGFYLEGSALQTITDGESTPSATLSEIEAMLHQKDTALPEPVINRVLTTIKCADKYSLQAKNVCGYLIWQPTNYYFIPMSRMGLSQVF